MDEAIIRQGELVGRGIMSYETTEEIGVVEHLLVNVQKAEGRWARVQNARLNRSTAALGLATARQDWQGPDCGASRDC